MENGEPGIYFLPHYCQVFLTDTLLSCRKSLALCTKQGRTSILRYRILDFRFIPCLPVHVSNFSFSPIPTMKYIFAVADMAAATTTAGKSPVFYHGVQHSL